MPLIRRNWARAQLDSPGWWGLATFFILVSQAVAQLVLLPLDAKRVVTTPSAQQLGVVGVLAGLAILLFALPFRPARAAAIGATGMLAFHLVGLAVHGLT
ncbi:MAG: hypothetical protein J2P17_27420 [Mycobacterium sp.]|nr:hypothetical protein [Mycobacterium sp.]